MNISWSVQNWATPRVTVEPPKRVRDRRLRTPHPVITPSLTNITLLSLRFHIEKTFAADAALALHFRTENTYQPKRLIRRPKNTQPEQRSAYIHDVTPKFRRLSIKSNILQKGKSDYKKRLLQLFRNSFFIKNLIFPYKYIIS